MVSAFDGLAARSYIGVAKVVPHHGRLVDRAPAIAEIRLLVGAEMLSKTLSRKVHRPGQMFDDPLWYGRGRLTGKSYAGRPCPLGRLEHLYRFLH